MEENLKPQESERAGTPSNRKRKVAAVSAVVLAVVVAAGAGFFVWHEQPSFCNAICHVPMDAYGETLMSGSQDKFGNAMATDEQKQSMLAYAHANLGDESVMCLDCHVPTLQEQISEGLHWVTGNYYVAGTNPLGQTILESRELSDLVEARGISEDEFCLNEACHTSQNGEPLTRDGLAALTAAEYGEYNPHISEHSEMACSTCHKAHSQSVNYCSECHEEATVPEGWLSAKEYSELSKLEQ